MFSKNRLNRFAHGLAAAVLAVGFTAACSDDPTVTPQEDAGPDAEEPCVGHTCPPTSATMTLPEGGVFRYELFHTGYVDGDVQGERTEILGGWAFMFTGQQPGARDILGPVVEGLEYAGGQAYCFNHTEANYFLSGWSERGQTIANTRSYYDLGPSLAMTSENGVEIPMPKQENYADPSTLLTHDTVYITDFGPAQAAALERNVKYPVPEIGPVAGGFPGLDLLGGFDVMAGANRLDPPAMYFPADFTLDTPTEEQYFAADTGLLIDPAQDLTFTWTHNAASPDGWVGQAQFTGFLNDDQTFQYLCVTPDNGTQVIPSGLFTQPDFPQSGKLIHGSITHVAWAQHVSDAEEYRIDLVGVNCKFSTYTLNVQ